MSLNRFDRGFQPDELRIYAHELNTAYLGGSKESSRLGHRSGDLMPSLTSQGKTADYCCFENTLLAMNCRLNSSFQSVSSKAV